MKIISYLRDGGSIGSSLCFCLHARIFARGLGNKDRNRPLEWTGKLRCQYVADENVRSGNSAGVLCRHLAAMHWFATGLRPPAPDDADDKSFVSMERQYLSNPICFLKN